MGFAVLVEVCAACSHLAVLRPGLTAALRVWRQALGGRSVKIGCLGYGTHLSAGEARLLDAISAICRCSR